MSTAEEPASAVDVGDHPPSELLYRRPIDLRGSVTRLWTGREVVRTLAERDLRVRYKQSILGVAWAFLVPVTLMLVFNTVLKRAVRVPLRGTPYVVWAYLALVPWTFTTNALTAGAQSLRANSSLLKKVRAPGEVFPLASVVVATVDAAIAAAVLVPLFVVTETLPKWSSYQIVPLLLIQVGFTVTLVLLFAPAVVYLRDIGQAMPVIVQGGFFVTPVVYRITPTGWLADLYAAINPLSTCIDGYRRAILFGDPQRWDLIAISGASVAVMLVGSYALFRHLETGLADVA